MLATAKTEKQNVRYVKKYGMLTRFAHAVHLISFLFLAFTGLALAYKWDAFGNMIFGSMRNVKSVHEFFGWILTIFGAIALLAMLPESIPKSYDLEWFAKLGGYLDPSHKTHVPAGRVNAGQKLYYWWCVFALIVMAITGFSIMYNLVPPHTKATFLVIHFVVAIIWIAFLIVHLYLGTIANPGSLPQMIDGKASVDYVKLHCPKWYEELKEKGLV